MTLYLADQYQARNLAWYSHYQTRIYKILPEARVDHIGSSAIPGAISKGDLDILVAVTQLQHMDAIQKIIKLGFQIKQGTLRTTQLCMLESTNGDDVAIQLIVEGSVFESFILFRDKLRSNSLLLQEYNQLKLDAQKFSMQHYRELKSRFIESVISDFTKKAPSID
ncbi:MAG: GrpB family protein [bacterium]